MRLMSADDEPSTIKVRIWRLSVALVNSSVIVNS